MDNEQPKLSTAFSDAILALVSLHAAQKLTGFIAAFGFLLTVLAASIGVIRFGKFIESNWVIKTHVYLSWVATVLGVPLVSYSFFKQCEYNIIANIFMACGLAGVATSSFLDEPTRKKTGELISTSAIIGTFLICLVHFNPYGLIGAALYAVAGLAVGTCGTVPFMGIPKVDIFHYTLAIANISLMLGVIYLQDPKPVFYKPSVTL